MIFSNYTYHKSVDDYVGQVGTSNERTNDPDDCDGDGDFLHGDAGPERTTDGKVTLYGDSTKRQHGHADHSILRKKTKLRECKG